MLNNLYGLYNLNFLVTTETPNSKILMYNRLMIINLNIVHLLTSYSILTVFKKYINTVIK